MIGMCHTCHRSGLETEICPNTGSPICEGCKPKNDEKIIEESSKLHCTCKPCPIHSEEIQILQIVEGNQE
jgi:hypothetical protein